ncbi:hypothetical protein [Streptomyces sp. NPDC059224]|uniref:hypothetical protein n=1 Tax=Streptomyces sp. NPDC059224 TaxID=3346775 RepID=UPI0036A5B28E
MTGILPYPYPSGPGQIRPPRECVTPGTAALLSGHVERERVQARIDCLARNRDRLAAYLAAVRPRGDRQGSSPRPPRSVLPVSAAASPLAVRRAA